MIVGLPVPGYECLDVAPQRRRRNASPCGSRSSICGVGTLPIATPGKDQHQEEEYDKAIFPAMCLFHPAFSKDPADAEIRIRTISKVYPAKSTSSSGGYQ